MATLLSGRTAYERPSGRVPLFFVSGQACRPGGGVPILRASMLLLLTFAPLAPVGSAAAEPAPAVRCTDFLARMHRKPPHLVFVGCRPLPDQQGRPLRATYRVEGRHAAGVEASLARTTGLAPLRRSCCQWDAPPRWFTDRVGHSFRLTMVSDETTVAHRAQWTLIRSFQVTVDAFTEEI